MSYDPQIHNRRSIRLKGYDYTQPGAYFVTICTWQRVCLFGEVINGVMRLNAMGCIVEDEWRRLKYHFANLQFGVFVVMPNHVHAIIIITTAVGATRLGLTQTFAGNEHPPAESLDGNEGSPLPFAGNDYAPDQQLDCNEGSPLRSSPTRPNGPPPGSLGAIIGQFKSRATKRIWALPGNEHAPIWQRNYYEHIIRAGTHFQSISDYISHNPGKWDQDQLHPSAPPNAFNQCN